MSVHHGDAWSASEPFVSSSAGAAARPSSVFAPSRRPTNGGRRGKCAPRALETSVMAPWRSVLPRRTRLDPVGSGTRFSISPILDPSPSGLRRRPFCDSWIYVSSSSCVTRFTRPVLLWRWRVRFVVATRFPESKQLRAIGNELATEEERTTNRKREPSKSPVDPRGLCGWKKTTLLYENLRPPIPRVTRRQARRVLLYAINATWRDAAARGPWSFFRLCFVRLILT